MAMFSGAVLVLLCAHTVFGFAMIDFLRASRQLEAQYLQRSLTSPANAIVDVVQGAMDSDENGEISIAEVEAYINRWFDQRRLGIHHREQIRYMLAVANLIDTNDDGNISRGELRRVAGILVHNAGNIQAGRIIELKTIHNSRQPSYSPQIEASQAVDLFMEATDSNEDGEISVDEMEIIFGLRRFRYFRQNLLNSKVEEADGNDNGNLNRAEALQFIINLGFGTDIYLFTYLEIYNRVGRQLAEEWADTR